jgi:hypothetical protein
MYHGGMRVVPMTNIFFRGHIMFSNLIGKTGDSEINHAGRRHCEE